MVPLTTHAWRSYTTPKMLHNMLTEVCVPTRVQTTGHAEPAHHPPAKKQQWCAANTTLIQRVDMRRKALFPHILLQAVLSDGPWTMKYKDCAQFHWRHGYSLSVSHARNEVAHFKKRLEQCFRDLQLIRERGGVSSYVKKGIGVLTPISAAGGVPPPLAGVPED